MCIMIVLLLYLEEEHWTTGISPCNFYSVMFNFYLCIHFYVSMMYLYVSAILPIAE